MDDFPGFLQGFWASSNKLLFQGLFQTVQVSIERIPNKYNPYMNLLKIKKEYSNNYCSSF